MEAKGQPEMGRIRRMRVMRKGKGGGAGDGIKGKSGQEGRKVFLGEGVKDDPGNGDLDGIGLGGWGRGNCDLCRPSFLPSFFPQIPFSSFPHPFPIPVMCRSIIPSRLSPHSSRPSAINEFGWALAGGSFVGGG
jgi:hypothetical protein